MLYNSNISNKEDWRLNHACFNNVRTCAPYRSDERGGNDEYQRLLSLCRGNNIKDPKDLSRFITFNKIGLEFPNLAGDVEFSNGGVLENGISPTVYHDLCVDLKFTPYNKKGVYVTKYTPNRKKHLLNR